MPLGVFPSGDSPAVVRWVAFIVAGFAFIICVGCLFLAVNSHISGKATYRYGPRGMLSEAVDSQTEPKKYNEALQKLYFRAVAAGLIGSVSLVFFKKLGE